MKIDGLDWIDWLHRLRTETEAERKRQGISIAERLRRAEATAERIERERSTRPSFVARDRKPEADKP